MKKILITGVTGHLGKSVIHLLLKKPNASQLVALTRDASKTQDLISKGVEIRNGDYNDYSSLVQAFKGIDALYFVSGSDIVNRTKQHENVVKAAKEAGVKHVVYTSFERKNETATSPLALLSEAHLKTEQWLKESGLTYTILKHNLYTDILPMFLGENVVESGIIYVPAGDGKVSFVWREDMAEVGATILTTTGHENKIYDITSNTAVSFQDIAKSLSQITGKPITYVSPTQEDFIKTITEAGIPMEFAGMTAGFAEAIKQGEFDQTATTIETLIGRKPVSIQTFLEQVYASKSKETSRI